MEFRAESHPDPNSFIDSLHSQIDEYMYTVKYYTLIREDLIKNGKILPGQSDKNGVGKPIFDEQNNLIGVQIFSEHKSFILTPDEIRSIKEKKKNPLATRRNPK